MTIALVLEGNSLVTYSNGDSSFETRLDASEGVI